MEERYFALLIDADNVSAKYITPILTELSKYGVITYKRIYGDWTSTLHSAWKEELLTNSITPVQQFSYTTGKNATDSAMIIDAMDILYANDVNGFCIVSSDSDFTRLVSRLRESGKMVIGMGEKKTPRPFVTACNEFKFIDKIGKTAQSADSDSDKAAAAPAAGRDASTSQTDLSSIRGTILQQLANFSDEDGWMMASRIGDVLTQRYPDFDVRNYGHKKLTSFLNSFDDFELRTANENNADNPNGHTVYIRVKPKNARKH